jgi:hypothetical protein
MKVTISILLALSTSAFGAAMDTVVCRDSSGQVKSAELREFFEGRELRKLRPTFEANLTSEIYISMIAKKYEQFSGDKFALKNSLSFLKIIQDYREGKTSPKNIIFTSERLVKPTVIDEIIPPQGCEYEQAMLFPTTNFPDDPQMIFQSDVILQMDEANIRGLVMKYALSERNPYLLQKLASRGAERFDFVDFAKVLKDQPYSRFLRNLDRTIWTTQPLKDFALVFDGKTNVLYAFDRKGEIAPAETVAHGGFTFSWFFDLEMSCNGKIQSSPVRLRDASVEVRENELALSGFELPHEYNIHSNRMILSFGDLDYDLSIPTSPMVSRNCVANDLSFAFSTSTSIQASIKKNRIEGPIIVGRRVPYTASGKVRAKLDEYNQVIFTKVGL